MPRKQVTGREIKINGQWIDVSFARMVYRCEVCFGELEKHNHGLRCKTNPEHRGFLHQNDVEEVQQQQENSTEKISDFYTIENGKVIIK